MALSKPNLKTLKNSTLEPSIDKSILNVNIDGVLQNKAGAVYVEDPNGYLQKIYITDNFGNYQQLIRTTTKQDIYLGQEFKKNEGYTEVIGGEEVVNGNFATDTNWTLSSGLTFNQGGILFDNNNDNLFQNWTDVVGKTYKISITQQGSGTLRYRTGYASPDSQQREFSSAGIAYFVSTSNTNRIQIYGAGNNDEIILTSVSVKEDTLYV